MDTHYFVSVKNLNILEKYEAAVWAANLFGLDNVIFFTGPENTFSFIKSEDAMLFALKWIK